MIAGYFVYLVLSLSFTAWTFWFIYAYTSDKWKVGKF
jgi:hypothetical protein